MAKFGMSMCTLGMSAEFAKDGIAVNSLWPLTAIDTAAVRNLLGGEQMAAISRTPEIMADAAHAILTRPSREATGNFFIDELVLREAGVTDFSKYAPGAKGPLAARFLRARRRIRKDPDEGHALVRLTAAVTPTLPAEARPEGAAGPLALSPSWGNLAATPSGTGQGQP